ncbi:MAG TPA: TspO/MBR family protein [Kofleriaceae bacterium]|jgi:tryptophan-rich sensory protein|nr:TspO/MBR family protein [Kofleriaceae bacterium]
MTKILDFAFGKRPHSKLVGLGLSLLSYGVAALGARTMHGASGRATRRWYHKLAKPAGQPPDRLFGPMWAVLYGTIAYSGWRIWKAPPSPERSRALGLWAGQLALNGAWTPLFFGARRPRSALVDIVALDAAAGMYADAAEKVDRTAALAIVPYLTWLGYATYLNGGIVARNPEA